MPKHLSAEEPTVLQQRAEHHHAECHSTVCRFGYRISSERPKHRAPLILADIVMSMNPSKEN